jgi:hypothetical protein
VSPSAPHPVWLLQLHLFVALVTRE